MQIIIASSLRYHHGSSSSKWSRPNTTTAIDSLTEKVFDESGFIAEAAKLPASEVMLPLLTSNCPGWICFAEKTHPQAIPYLSTVKSPQQILGVLMKSILQHEGSIEDASLHTLDTKAPSAARRRVLVVSIQPCFDKKLEASRLVLPLPLAETSHSISLFLCDLSRTSTTVRLLLRRWTWSSRPLSSGSCCWTRPTSAPGSPAGRNQSQRLTSTPKMALLLCRVAWEEGRRQSWRQRRPG